MQLHLIFTKCAVTDAAELGVACDVHFVLTWEILSDQWIWSLVCWWVVRSLCQLNQLNPSCWVLPCLQPSQSGCWTSASSSTNEHAESVSVLQFWTVIAQKPRLTSSHSWVLWCGVCDLQGIMKSLQLFLSFVLPAVGSDLPLYVTKEDLDDK